MMFARTHELNRTLVMLTHYHVVSTMKIPISKLLSKCTLLWAFIVHFDHHNFMNGTSAHFHKMTSVLNIVGVLLGWFPRRHSSSAPTRIGRRARLLRTCTQVRQWVHSYEGWLYFMSVISMCLAGIFFCHDRATEHHQLLTTLCVGSMVFALVLKFMREFFLAIFVRLKVLQKT